MVIITLTGSFILIFNNVLLTECTYFHILYFAVTLACNYVLMYYIFLNQSCAVIILISIDAHLTLAFSLPNLK